MSTLFEAIAKKKIKVCHCLGTWVWWSGHGNTGQRTRETTERHHTRHSGHVRQQRARCDMMQVVFFWRHQRGPAPYTKRNAMQRSKFDIGRADAGAGGMSMISSSSGASGMGASSSSSDASAMAQSIRSSGASWSAAASATASLKWASLWARNGRHQLSKPCSRRRNP